MSDAVGTKQSEARGSVVSRASDYLSASVDELKKVHPPTRQEAMQATIVTIFIVIFISLVVSLMDLVFSWVTRMMI